MTLFTESVVDQTDHFADAFVHEKVAYVDDVVTVLCNSKVYSQPFCLEKSSVCKGVF